MICAFAHIVKALCFLAGLLFHKTNSIKVVVPWLTHRAVQFTESDRVTRSIRAIMVELHSIMA